MNEQLKDPSFSKAFFTAKTVACFLQSLRVQYSEMVMAKLKNDGFGAAMDAKYLKGFVPIHSTYLNAMGSALRQKKTLKSPFDFAQRSLWNLKFDQGLQDAFEKEAWDFLTSQQSDFARTGEPLQNMRWEPFVQVDTMEGKKVLRYFSPEAASVSSCVECHNKWEQSEEVKALRKIQGIEEGKTFSVGELLGALSVVVPLEDRKTTQEKSD